MLVSEAVGAALTGLGADTVFGVVGSGNFHVTNALIARGATFYAARHEGGAACMADGWARAAGRVGLLCVHQGPGLTVFTTFESETDYFGSRAQQTMLNFRVRDLDAMLAQLRPAAISVDEDPALVENAV